eukprot:1363159-Amorphochlora_amoeboformis.AAC.1
MATATLQSIRESPGLRVSLQPREWLASATTVENFASSDTPRAYKNPYIASSPRNWPLHIFAPETL